MQHNNRVASLVHLATLMHRCVISGFRREVDENCALLGYYATSSVKVTDVSGRPLNMGTDMSRNVVKNFATTCCVITQKSVVLMYSGS